jgi:hypothetical protein
LTRAGAFKTCLENGPTRPSSGRHFGWASGRRTVGEAVKDAPGFCKPEPGAKCAALSVNGNPAE